MWRVVDEPFEEFAQDQDFEGAEQFGFEEGKLSLSIPVYTYTTCILITLRLLFACINFDRVLSKVEPSLLSIYLDQPGFILCWVVA